MFLENKLLSKYFNRKQMFEPSQRQKKLCFVLNGLMKFNSVGL